MLSTGYSQLIEVFVLTGACLLSLVAIAYTAYVARTVKREFPGKTDINRLRGEVAQLSGEQADLTDRFSRFQKREGMREARDAKQSKAELEAQALALMQQGGSGTVDGTSPKAELYKRLRN